MSKDTPIKENALDMPMINVMPLVDDYLTESEWRTHENANGSYCYASLLNHASGTVIAKYTLEKYYKGKIAEAHTSGQIHIHDLSSGIIGYCFTGDTRVRLADGTNPTFKELVEKYGESKKRFQVYAYDVEKSKFVIANARFPRITKKVKKVAKVYWGDLAEPIVCTTDHKFLMSDGTYKPANKLKEHDVVMYTDYIFQSSKYYKPQKANTTHKIKRVIVENLREELEMYDLTVPVYQNFALDMGIFVHNCAGWSLKNLLQKGFKGRNGRASGKPAKHFDSALQQSENFLSTLQTEWAGAQAFNSFDTLLAPFIRKDNLNYTEVKQKIQSFIFGLNIASRWGQTPFTNLSLDWVCPEDMKNVPIVIGGEEDYTSFYGDYQTEMDMINRAFLEVMNEGDGDGSIFTFPIPTYNITKDFPWDSEQAKLLFKVTGHFGLPYFQNFISSDLDPKDIRSMCCRLRLDLSTIRTKTGGLFGAGDNTGSLGVCTLNMPRLGFLYKSDRKGFFNKLKELYDICVESLEIKRQRLNENFKKGLMPYSSIYLENFDNHFSTIGILGMHECCQNFFNSKDAGIQTKEGTQLAIDVLDTLRELIIDTQKHTGNIYNLEGVPGEGTTYRFARLDKRYFGDRIIQSGSAETPFYTNSTQLPVDYTSDMVEALTHQNELQTKYSGGSVLHLFLGEEIKDEQVVARLVKKIAENFKIPYFTLTPSFSICPVHGYIPGIHETCPFDAYQHATEKQDLDK